MAGLGSWISLPPSAIDQRNSAGALLLREEGSVDCAIAFLLAAA
jgi:hypothetical protein